MDNEAADDDISVQFVKSDDDDDDDIKGRWWWY